MALLPVLEGLHSAEAFSPAFLHALFARVEEIQREPERMQDALHGCLIATVFQEPSTRTRLSFEAAAQRLGAGILTVADSKTTSHVKGESLADTARVIGSYADLLVWRHPLDGASRLASQFSGVPVINGGDGRLGHPSQTLVDLVTLAREWGSLEGRTIGILGDLRHGRTARSLAWGLSLLGARVALLPAPGLDWEGGLEKRIRERTGALTRIYSHPLARAWTGSETFRLLEPPALLQPHLFGSVDPTLEKLDALYLTRLQLERGASARAGAYPGLLPEQMEDPLLADCLILHPLPRREELPTALDSDPRARYFEQARLGTVVRQALFLAILRPQKWGLPALTPLPAGVPDPSLGPCPNPGCVTHTESNLPVPWRVVGKRRRSFLCSYCDSLLPAEYAGCRSTLRVHSLHSPASLQIRPENLRPFRTRDQAVAAGYEWSG